VHRVYLDHAATTPLSAAAFDAMRPHLLEAAGNASSIHREGQAARAAVEEARSLVAAALAMHPDEVVFTSSGTEADNLALRGTAWLPEASARAHVVTSAIEHEAVLRTLRWLQRRGDVDVAVVPPRGDGSVDPAAVLAAVRPETALVSLMMVNNETGAIQPVEEVGRACRQRGIRFHVDAVQALGRLEVIPHGIPADLVSLSAHKVNGPQGCGVLCVRRGLKLQPVLTGGAQEGGLRAGTEAVAAIAGGARAMADAAAHRQARCAHVAALSQRLEAGLLELPGVAVNAAPCRRAVGIVNASFEGVDAVTLVQALDLHGIAASAGSACTAGSTAPSHVLEAMGLSPERTRGAVRFSLGQSNAEEEIAWVLEVLPSVLAAARHAVAT
jgi:cysteine desulfurase